MLLSGDRVVDVGANVSHYAKQFSDLVGLTARVIAIDPVPQTLAVLPGNTCYFRHANVNPVNVVG